MVNVRFLMEETAIKHIKTVQQYVSRLAQPTGQTLGRLSFRRVACALLLVAVVTTVAAPGLATLGAMTGGQVGGGVPPTAVAGVAAPAAPTGGATAPAAPASTTPLATTTGAATGAAAHTVPANAKAMKLTDSELYLLAALISGEARDEPFVGQVAVGAVVLNRVRAGGQFGHTVSEVIFQPGQYEAASNGQMWAVPVPASCLEAAKAAASGQDPTGGALYYFNPAKTSNAWMWSRPVKLVIGHHRFTY